MNRHCYRIVFNAARGQLMVVAETAADGGKSTSARRRRRRATVPPANPATRRQASCTLRGARGEEPAARTLPLLGPSLTSFTRRLGEAVARGPAVGSARGLSAASGWAR